MYSYKEWMVRTYDTTAHCGAPDAFDSDSDDDFSFGNHKKYTIWDELARDIEYDANFPESKDYRNIENQREKVEEYIRTKYKGDKTVITAFKKSWSRYCSYERYMYIKYVENAKVRK